MAARGDGFPFGGKNEVIMRLLNNPRFKWAAIVVSVAGMALILIILQTHATEPPSHPPKATPARILRA